MSAITKEFTKEQLQQIIETDHVQCGEASSLARIALASLEAEPAGWQVKKHGGDWVSIKKEDVDHYRFNEDLPVREVYTAPPAPVSVPDDFICMLTGRAKYLREKGEIKSPELLERAAAALQGEIVNTSSIPNGWKLVPIDPTKDMLRAGQSVVGFWLNTVHCYSKMLAAAPAAPHQEVK